MELDTSSRDIQEAITTTTAHLHDRLRAVNAMNVTSEDKMEANSIILKFVQVLATDSVLLTERRLNMQQRLDILRDINRTQEFIQEFDKEIDTSTLLQAAS